MAIREIRTERNSEGVLRRRWFSDRLLDLIVWQGPDDEIKKFQLCYKLKQEYGLVWDHKSGFSHYQVDDGEGVPRYPRSPIMTADEAVNTSVLSALLHGTRNHLDGVIYEFIAKKIHELDQ